MENQLAAPTEDGQPKSATQVVSVVLHQNTKTNHFLRNVGNQVAKRRTTLQNVQAKLEVEKRTNSELQSIVKNQHEEMDGLKNQVQGTEQARIKDQEENRKKQAELEKKIELLLSQNGQS
jgi:predicted RNase H-like nuclease (RuvC/YqgF family)